MQKQSVLGEQDKLSTSPRRGGGDGSALTLLLLLLVRSFLKPNHSPVGYCFRGKDAERHEKSYTNPATKTEAKSGGFREQVHSYISFIPMLSYTNAPHEANALKVRPVSTPVMRFLHKHHMTFE